MTASVNHPNCPCPECRLIKRKGVCSEPVTTLKLNDDGLWINMELNGKHAAINLDHVGPAKFFCAEFRAKYAPRPKCDGNHGGPRCADPECWIDEAAPVAAAWDGKGKPALGGWCEYRSADEEWIPCEVVAYRADQLVIVDALGYACVVGASELRPARTPEQIAAEERIKAAQEWLKGVEREYGVEAADECENILMAAEAKRVAK